MAKTASIVDINGSRYNSVTGEVLGSIKATARRSQEDQVIDGFVKQKAATKVPKPKSRVEPAAKKPRQARVVHASAKSIHNRKEHSHTLVRAAVARPKLRLKEASANLSAIAKPSLKSLGTERINRAKMVPKDSRVSRFGLKLPSSTVETQAASKAAAVKPAKRITKQAIVKPLAKPLPSMVTSASHQRLERILDEALLKADAHKQALKYRRRNPLAKIWRLPRWLSIVIIVLAIVLIAGLIIWQTVPAVAVKVASIRSHVSATSPAYTPTGFSMNSVQAQTEAVSIKYQAKADPAANYVLTQTKSNWDSSSLAANTIAKDESVQTSEVGGTTVYIYGSSNDAAWVTGGQLYKIENNAHLNSDQILKIAQSL